MLYPLSYEGSARWLKGQRNEESSYPQPWGVTEGDDCVVCGASAPAPR